MKSRELRYFTKLDSKGKPIPGVLVARKKNPEHTDKNTGHWMEIYPYNCCVTQSITSTVTGTQAGATSVTFLLNINGSPAMTYVSDTMPHLLTALNSNRSVVGSYTLIDLTNDSILFTPKSIYAHGTTFSSTVTYA